MRVLLKGGFAAVKTVDMLLNGIEVSDDTVVKVMTPDHGRGLDLPVWPRLI